jgi:hypothetical protein
MQIGTSGQVTSSQLLQSDFEPLPFFRPGKPLLHRTGLWLLITDTDVSDVVREKGPKSDYL